MVRLAEARKSIFLLVKSNLFKSIVIVDGSNCEILSDIEIKHLRDEGVEVEQIRFKQNSEEVRHFGKSNGEQQIMNYMLKKSILVNQAGNFYKLSSRYLMVNQAQVLSKIDHLDNVFFYFNPPLLRNFRPYICTSFYKTSVSFYKKYLADCIDECNMTSNGRLEAVYFKKIKRCKKKGLLVPFPFFTGLGGTLAMPIENRHYYVRNIFSKFGLLAYSFDTSNYFV